MFLRGLDRRAGRAGSVDAAQDNHEYCDYGKSYAPVFEFDKQKCADRCASLLTGRLVVLSSDGPHENAGYQQTCPLRPEVIEIVIFPEQEIDQVMGWNKRDKGYRRQKGGTLQEEHGAHLVVKM